MNSPSPIRVHPDNPKVFEFRGRPLVLLTATEHYGAVINRRFRFERYLADAAERGMTLTRLFVLFRELQSAANPYSTCKPESTDYIAPFKRVGPELALDCQPKYDLDQWNDEFFDRLNHFLTLASDRRIVVEVVLFSNTYADNIWALNPLNPRNNVNGMARIDWPDYTSLRHPALFERQVSHARKIVEATRDFDNVIYEICNEPGGGHSSKPTHPSPAEVDQWQAAIAQVIRESDVVSPNDHLIAGQPAFHYPPKETWEAPVTQPVDLAFNGFPVDVVNVHPLPRMRYRGRMYDTGRFMLGDLHLRELRAFALAIYHERKPLNFDEDNVATQFRDTFGWTVHRKRAWTSLFCGAHYDMIDFSIWPYLETGTDESQQQLRAWFGHLSRWVHGMDLVNARPLPDWLGVSHSDVVASTLAVEGDDYCVYLADGRERGEPGWGNAITCEITFELPDAASGFLLYFFSPATGITTPRGTLAFDQRHAVAVPPFEHDLAIRIQKP